MDSRNKARLDYLPLGRLVARALRHLEHIGYSRRSLRRYDNIWRHLVSFADERGFGDEFSEDLAAGFVGVCRSHDDARCGWRLHAAFGVRMLGDFRRDGRIERSRTDRCKLNIPPAMRKPLRDYEAYGIERRHLRASTIDARTAELGRFLDFLGARGVQTLPQIRPGDLTAYMVWLERYRPKTISRIVSSVRQFLRFLTMRGILLQDLAEALPKVRVTQNAAIPSVWDSELVVKLLQAVDRSSPFGKRDYAMLLLASRLGLRSGDLRTLRLDDIDWGASIIAVTQSKTAAPLHLPISEEVGEALIDYLRFGRPETEHREVFLRLKRPVGPFAQDSHLHEVVNRWRELAGIRFVSRQRHGLHSLRHTLATQLLREQTPVHVISEILGHATTASTLIYAKADTETLRSAALDTEEVHDVE